MSEPDESAAGRGSWRDWRGAPSAGQGPFAQAVEKPRPQGPGLVDGAGAAAGFRPPAENGPAPPTAAPAFRAMTRAPPLTHPVQTLSSCAVIAALDRMQRLRGEMEARKVRR